MKVIYKSIGLVFFVFFANQSSSTAEQFQLDFVGYVKHKHVRSIPSPIDGVVSELDVQAGDLVGIGDVLARVDNIDSTYPSVTFKSPVNGYKVERVEKYAGETVQSNDILLSLVHPEEFQVEFSFSHKDFHKIHKGKKVQISLDSNSYTKYLILGEIVALQAPSSHLQPFMTGLISLECNKFSLSYELKCSDYLNKGTLVRVSISKKTLIENLEAEKKDFF